MEGGPPCFQQDFSCPVVLKIDPHQIVSLSSTGLSPSLTALPSSIPLTRLLRRTVLRPLQNPLTTPTMQRRKAYTSWVWALPRSLAATRGISFDFSSSRYLDGSVPWVFLPYAIVFTYESLWFSQSGYPIRTSADQWIFAPPHGFSQLITSFFAWQLPGILRRPLFA